MKPTLALLLLTATAVLAVEPEHRHLGSFADFAEGRGHGVSLQADGSLCPGPVVTAAGRVEAQRLWAIATDGQVLWLGTGDEGRLYRWAEGQAELWLDAPEIGIQALVPDGAGGVYAGTSPDGIVYHVQAGDSDGPQVTTLSRTGSRYVWALAVDARGRVLAATGAPARVLRLDADGDQTVLLDAGGDGHVRCLVRAGDGWIAGTAVASGTTENAEDRHQARIYALDDHGARLLVETSHQEVSALVARGDTLFAAVTTSPGTATGAGDDGQPQAALLRLNPDGASYPVWQGTGVWAGLVDAGDGTLTGVLREPGRVLRLHPDGGPHGRLAHVDSLVPNAVARGDEALWVGDGRNGRLWRLAPAAADSGWFETPVQDLGAVARWGALEWAAEVPRGAALWLRTRSGQSSSPDDTWSPWSVPLEASGTAVSSPTARYLQMRVGLRRAGNGATACLRRLSFTARQANLPPVIQEVTTFAYRDNGQGKSNPPSQPGANGNGQRHLPQKKTLRLVRWQASDANGDELRYRLYLRGEGQHAWKPAEEDLETTTVVWDTETMPEGMTQLRLVAGDEHDNPPEQALQAEWISPPFAIDNTPPSVELEARRDEGAVVLEARFVDRVTGVRGARLAIDYDEAGRRLAAADGLFDSRRERATARLEELTPGEHVISVQAWDDLENVGVGRLVITVER